jgi:hypothetical protein
MVAFIDERRDTYGVEPICAVLPIAPSTYFLRKAKQEDPEKQPARARRGAPWRASRIAHRELRISDREPRIPEFANHGSPNPRATFPSPRTTDLESANTDPRIRDHGSPNPRMVNPRIAGPASRGCAMCFRLRDAGFGFGIGIRDCRFGIRDFGTQDWDAGFGMRDWGCAIGDAGLGMRDWGCGIRDARLGMRDSGFRIRD